MTIIQQQPLPEAVSVALACAVADITTANPETVPTVLGPLLDACHDAVEDLEAVDFDIIYDAFPALTADIADTAQALLDKARDDAISLMPIMVTFAEMKPVRALSGLRVLSFEDGKGGRDFDAWRNEALSALWIALRLPDGPIPSRVSPILSALEDAFFDGREAGGINGDPPRRVSVYYAARAAAAREAVQIRLANACDLDGLADEIVEIFKIYAGTAWAIVEEVSRAAAIGGNLHAARLRSAQIIGVHRWFAGHAEDIEKSRPLTAWMRRHRDQSLSILAGVAA